MRDLIINRGLRIFLAIATCITSIATCTAQSKELQAFQGQMDVLLRDGGRWRAENRKFDAQDEGSARYFGYEFQKGVSPTTLKLKITGYLPRQSQWAVYWDGYYAWDSKMMKVIYTSAGADGSSVSGNSEFVDANRLDLVLTLVKSDGTIEEHKDTQRLVGDKLVSESMVKKSGKWEPNNSLTWVRQERPRGFITFMSTRDGNFEVYSMKATGDSVVNLTCNKATDYSFAYTPDGRLMFYSNRDGNDEIYLQAADGKKAVNLTNHPAADRIHDISPDGTLVVFSSNRDSKSPDIYTMNLDGSSVRRLTANENFEDAPAWSPDGKKIVFSRDIRAATDATPEEASNGEIFVMDADGANVKQLTHRPGFDGGAQFSPDGSKIAFYGRTDEGHYEIFLMNADGSNLVNLTEDAMEDYSPCWSPDGQWIAFTRGNSSNYDVWAMHLATRIKHRLTSQPRRDESPIWRESK